MNMYNFVFPDVYQILTGGYSRDGTLDFRFTI